MTLPDERSNAVRHTRRFLESLLDPGLTPNVPRDIRLQARACLKHYPTNYDMEHPESFSWAEEKKFWKET